MPECQQLVELDFGDRFFLNLTEARLSSSRISCFESMMIPIEFAMLSGQRATIAEDCY
jgi:hypothetical protein